ncbi:flavin-containing monooxygenase [Parendozoicomonas haliclonae]|uniref:Flavin-containing monooxygenase 5 n=1 Tax=Parendozoicomonas haliclonae TaxID=1960125 RepID=A0A1X7APD1_9GAMM|nr:NAD(P)-binding domain-containing protein [Parendozoicomonas haliclonae]SMA49950.1 putative oxidoreductase CzcO [Parendozoicomonas haliclonae]
MTDSLDRVAIIGAGPAGLATARALKALKIPFDVFEKHSNVGGIWDRSNPGSPMYRTAHFISSRTMSGHQGFPMPDHYPDYPSNEQILTYIQSFAKTFDLEADIRFNTVVNNVRKQEQYWQLESTHNGLTTTENYRWVVCANGTNWHPNRPTLKGEENFHGKIIHAVDYHDTAMLRDKRVLVVGAGNSGVDIASDAGFNAKQGYLSLRRGYHFVPKHIMGEPADVFGAKSDWMPMWLKQKSFGFLLRMLNGDLTRLGLKNPDHKVMTSHPIMNTQVLHYLQHGDLIAKPDIDHLEGNTVYFDDDSSADIDLIILATGYHWRIPYLNNLYFPWKNERPQTFLKIFNKDYPSLFINGFVETNGGAYKLFDDMAFLIANVIQAQKDNPLQAKTIQRYIEGPEPDLSGNIRFIDSARHTGYTNSRSYQKAMETMRKDFGWTEGYEKLAAKVGI